MTLESQLGSSSTERGISPGRALPEELPGNDATEGHYREGGKPWLTCLQVGCEPRQADIQEGRWAQELYKPWTALVGKRVPSGHPCGTAAGLGDVALNLMSLRSQGQLLSTQTEIPMQGMKVLVG